MSLLQTSFNIFKMIYTSYRLVFDLNLPIINKFNQLIIPTKCPMAKLAIRIIIITITSVNTNY